MANLSEKISLFRSEAAEHGDTVQVVLCDIAEGVFGDAYAFDADDFTTLSRDESLKLRGVTVDSAREMCRQIIVGVLELV